MIGNSGTLPRHALQVDLVLRVGELLGLVVGRGHAGRATYTVAGARVYKYRRVAGAIGRTVRGAALLAAVAAIANAPTATADTWFAGDGHVHTCYSHDAYCGPDDENYGPDVLLVRRDRRPALPRGGRSRGSTSS